MSDEGGKAPKVLVMEDYADTRDMVRVLLEMRGCQVVEAEDGAKAVEAARAEGPDLILMDLHLPVLDGFAATLRLKQDAETQGIPVVAMSAHCGDSGWAELSRRVGCLECVPKPIDVSVLDRVLDTYARAR